MATCCVCKNYYDPATLETSNVYECPRCHSDNTLWEEVQRRSFLTILGDMGGLLYVPVIIVVAQMLVAPYFGFNEGKLQRFAFLVLILSSATSTLIMVICYALRFRIREYALLRGVSTSRRPSPLAMMLVVPLAAILLALGAIVGQEMLGKALDDLPVGPREVLRSLYTNLARPTPDVETILAYVSLSGLVFSTSLLVIKRYGQSLDLPQPIFITVPLMREVAIKDYFDKPGAGLVPKEIECRELGRTPKGGLTMTVSWKAGEKTTKDPTGQEKRESDIRNIKLECDRWARLVSAKNEAKSN